MRHCVHRKWAVRHGLIVHNVASGHPLNLLAHLLCVILTLAFSSLRGVFTHEQIAFQRGVYKHTLSRKSLILQRERS